MRFLGRGSVFANPHVAIDDVHAHVFVRRCGFVISDGVRVILFLKIIKGGDGVEVVERVKGFGIPGGAGIGEVKPAVVVILQVEVADAEVVEGKPAVLVLAGHGRQGSDRVLIFSRLHERDGAVHGVVVFVRIGGFRRVQVQFLNFHHQWLEIGNLILVIEDFLIGSAYADRFLIRLEDRLAVQRRPGDAPGGRQGKEGDQESEELIYLSHSTPHSGYIVDENTFSAVMSF